jgi:hypothetical protein
VTHDLRGPDIVRMPAFLDSESGVVAASPTHPLVLYLDDLKWAATLRLRAQLISASS